MPANNYLVSVVVVVVVAPSAAGAAMADESEVTVVVLAAESVMAGAVVSTVVGSVVVVSVVAVFDSHEVRAAANTKARAETFRRFFIFGVTFEKVCLKNAVHTAIFRR
jgi:hypothetical protein